MLTRNNNTPLANLIPTMTNNQHFIRRNRANRCPIIWVAENQNCHFYQILTKLNWCLKKVKYKYRKTLWQQQRQRVALQLYGRVVLLGCSLKAPLWCLGIVSFRAVQFFSTFPKNQRGEYIALAVKFAINTPPAVSPPCKNPMILAG